MSPGSDRPRSSASEPGFGATADASATLWSLVEPCCGSASLTLHLLGARRPLLPYQGSKWRFRAALGARIAAVVGAGAPREVALFDPGPWGIAAPTVLDPALRSGVAALLEDLAARDARAVYDALHQGPAPADPVAYTAQFLFLQRLAYSGKAVGVRDGRWSSPGFNTSSAYGLPGTDRFGAVRPMIPSLVRVLRGYRGLATPAVRGAQRGAPAPEGPVRGPTLVYLDPPYQGSTRYPNGDLDRAAVVALARAWREAGATVVVSEAEALPELVSDGWSAELLTEGRGDTSPFRGKQQEWLTIGRA